MIKRFRSDLLILNLAAVLFFISAGFLWIKMPWVFNSPDENANAFFAIQIMLGRLPEVHDSLLQFFPLLHPRSVIVVGENLVPVSFLGLPVVYGFLAKLFGYASLRVWTSLLAIAAVFAWRSLIEKIFASKKIALLSSLFVFFHPAFWYYTGRSLMHNVPFVSLLMIVAYLLIVQPWKKHQVLNFLFAGALLSLALAFRVVEIVWIAPVLIALFIRFRKQIDPAFATIFLLSAATVSLPFFWLNKMLYGSPLVMGYTYRPTIEAASAVSSVVSDASSSFAFYWQAFKTTLRNMWNYSVFLFPWLSFGAFFGFLAVLGTKKKRTEMKVSEKCYALTSVFVAATLWIMYGFWQIHDNPDPTLVTIGTSYIRYWLPMFVLASPYLASFIVWLSVRTSLKFARETILVGLTVLLIGLSINPVFSAEDGLFSARTAMKTFADKEGIILSQTEVSSVIIVDRADKYLWPERRVIVPLRSQATYDVLPALAQAGPIYYFGITFPESDFTHLNQNILGPLGLEAELVVTINEESLYRIYETSP